MALALPGSEVPSDRLGYAFHKVCHFQQVRGDFYRSIKRMLEHVLGQETRIGATISKTVLIYQPRPAFQIDLIQLYLRKSDLASLGIILANSPSRDQCIRPAKLISAARWAENCRLTDRVHL